MLLGATRPDRSSPPLLGAGLLGNQTTLAAVSPDGAAGAAYVPGSTVLRLADGRLRLLPPGAAEPVTVAAEDPAALAAVARERAWLAAGAVPGAATAEREAAAASLLFLRLLVRPGGAALAAQTPYWAYVWPRDASFVAAALAVTGHRAEAAAILGFLARSQRPDGTWPARSHPDGRPVTDGRPAQLDATGWVPWAAWLASDQGRDRRLAERLWPTVLAAADVAAGSPDGRPPGAGPPAGSTGPCGSGSGPPGTSATPTAAARTPPWPGSRRRSPRPTRWCAPPWPRRGGGSARAAGRCQGGRGSAATRGPRRPPRSRWRPWPAATGRRPRSGWAGCSTTAPPWARSPSGSPATTAPRARSRRWPGPTRSCCSRWSAARAGSRPPDLAALADGCRPGGPAGPIARVRRGGHRPHRRPTRSGGVRCRREPCGLGLVLGLADGQALVHQHVEGGGDRDRHERPDQAEQGRADQAGQQHRGLADVDGGLQHPGGDQVVLDLLVGDEEGRQQHRRRPQRAGEQRHRHAHDRPERRPDHRDHVEDRHHDSQRHREPHPEQPEGQVREHAGHDRDDDVADHVAADLVDHQVDDLRGPDAAVGGEQPHQPVAQARQVGHEVGGEHQHGEGREQRAEQPAGEAEHPGADPARDAADHALQLG